MSLFSFLQKREIYSDFPKTLDKNPVSLDVTRYVNEKSVKESLRNLILTNRGERLMDPTKGCGIQKMIFDNLTPDKVIVMRELIKETIENYEPRVSIIDIDILSGYDDGRVVVTLLFNVINIEEPIEYAITISRIR